LSVVLTKIAKGGSRAALTPQRSNGRERVTDILETAAKVIRERGFDATTMKEIAERSQTNTGSLYRFFPNKESIAEALIERYSRLVAAEFDRIETVSNSAPIDRLADNLIDFLLTIHEETLALSALLDSRADGFVKRKEFRNRTLQRICAILASRAPKLDKKVIKDIAVVLLHAMKIMVAISVDPTAATSPGAAEQLRIMNRLYLMDRLGDATRLPGRAKPSRTSR
jgi:AcrR family transcriptional regulator